jgi:hypothetical protein
MNNIKKENIIKSYQEDKLQRGEDLLVYDYFGRITKLKNIEISYDINGNYRKPKEYKPKEYKPKEYKPKNNCIII